MSKLLKIILNIARSLAMPISNFLIAIVGVKYLGKENWGDFIQVLLWIYFVVFIANFGNKDFLLRLYSKNPSTIYSHFSKSFFSRIVFLSLAVVLFFFFSIKIALLSILLSILIYSYQSIESLVIFKQKFLTQLIAETVGFTIILGFIFYKTSLSTTTLLMAYCIAFLLKFTIVIVALKIDFKQFEFRFSKDQIKPLIPFFLIGFSGWLASKIDLYVVNLLLPKTQLATYQLLITAFLMLQAFAAYIIYPFTKHLYRLNNTSIQKIKKILYAVSLPLISFCTLLIWFVFEYFVKLNLNINLYILGAFSALPIFFFIVDIIQFYKNGEEKKVMYINFATAIISLILTLILIPIYGIKGALLSVVITQYLLLILYKSKWIPL